MHIKTRLLSAAAAATLLTTGAFATITQVSAQEPEPPVAEQGARKGKFLERVAEKLGITKEELQAAIQGAANDAVDEALAEGRITQDQADKARERIETNLSMQPAASLPQHQVHATAAMASYHPALQIIKIIANPGARVDWRFGGAAGSGWA